METVGSLLSSMEIVGSSVGSPLTCALLNLEWKPSLIHMQDICTVRLILTLTILFYSILQIFYSILFYSVFSILYSILSCCTILYYALFCILFYYVFYSIIFYLARYSILFYFVFYSVNSIMQIPKFCEYFLTSLILTFY